MIVNFDDLTVINDLRERATRVTQEQYDAVVRKLKPAGAKERSVGVVTSENTRALYILSTVLRLEEVMQIAFGHTALTEEMENDHKEKAAILDMLDDVAREIFQTQVKLDLGYYKSPCGCLGIRAGWMLVECEDQRTPQGLAGLLRLGLPMPDDGE